MRCGFVLKKSTEAFTEIGVLLYTYLKLMSLYLGQMKSAKTGKYTLK